MILLSKFLNLAPENAENGISLGKPPNPPTSQQSKLIQPKDKIKLYFDTLTPSANADFQGWRADLNKIQS